MARHYKTEGSDLRPREIVASEKVAVQTPDGERSFQDIPDPRSYAEGVFPGLWG